MLAGDPSTSGVVKRLSEFNRLAVNASVQVGEHHAGAGNCRASIGNGGIAAGFTGNDAGDVVAQLASSALQVSTASRNLPGTLTLSLGGFEHCGCSALLFIALHALGLPGCLCDCFHLLCMFCPQLLNLRIGLPAAHRPSCRCRNDGDQHAERERQPRPDGADHTSPA